MTPLLPGTHLRKQRNRLHASSVLLVQCFFLCILSTLTSAKSVSTSLERQQPRILRPGTTRGFHRHLVLHDPYVKSATDPTFLHRLLRLLRLKSKIERAATEKYHSVELYGGMVAVGEYYARVKIGGQTLRVQIDTGSATLAAPLKQCSNCKRGDMRYAVEQSDSGIAEYITCDHEQCQEGSCDYGCGQCNKARRTCCAKANSSNCAFHLNFGDGSGAKGMLVRDSMEWSDVKFAVTFGGIASDSPNFERKQVDGILGMAYRSLACNPSCITPAFDAMLEQEKDNGMPDSFSICITYDSGRLVLGEYDKSLSNKEITWVPLHLSTPPSFYSFPVIGDLLVDDKPLRLPSYSQAIVDSGTTLIVFSSATFNTFKQHLLTHYCEVPGLCPDGDDGEESWFQAAHCTKLRDNDRKKLPTLTFRLEGFDLKMGPDDYMINYASKGTEFWCVGIMSLDSMSGGVDVILGNTVMKRYVTVYDRENKKVGFAESDNGCGLSTKPGSNPNSPHDDSDGNDSNVNGQGTGNGEENNEVCAAGRNCTDCIRIKEASCKWDANNKKCVGGSALPWMCKLEEIESNIGFWIGGSVVAVVAAIIVVAVVVRIVKRQDDGALDDESETEVQPLAEGEQGNDTVDTKDAFAIAGEDEDEESGRR